jgi:hypothetical protein
MRPKIRCDGESTVLLQNFLNLNWAEIIEIKNKNTDKYYRLPLLADGWEALHRLVVDAGRLPANQSSCSAPCAPHCLRFSGPVALLLISARTSPVAEPRRRNQFEEIASRTAKGKHIIHHQFEELDPIDTHLEVLLVMRCYCHRSQ